MERWNAAECPLRSHNLGMGFRKGPAQGDQEKDKEDKGVEKERGIKGTRIQAEETECY